MLQRNPRITTEEQIKNWAWMALEKDKTSLAKEETEANGIKGEIIHGVNRWCLTAEDTVSRDRPKSSTKTTMTTPRVHPSCHQTKNGSWLQTQNEDSKIDKRRKQSTMELEDTAEHLVAYRRWCRNPIHPIRNQRGLQKTPNQSKNHFDGWVGIVRWGRDSEPVGQQGCRLGIHVPIMALVVTATVWEEADFRSTSDEETPSVSNFRPHTHHEWGK